MSSSSHRPAIAIAFAGLTAATAAVLHSNPFGEGELSWIASALIAAAGNALLAFVLAPRIAPHIAAPAAGIAAPSAEHIRLASFGTALTLMALSLASLVGVGLVSGDPIIVPTERLERNAKLARTTIKAKAPAEFQGSVPAADTLRLRDNIFRTCVPARTDRFRTWCVTIEATDSSTKVLRYGIGTSNPELFRQAKERGEPIG